RHGYDREQSQDLTQGFFTLLIEKNYLLNTDHGRGRFRSFLLASVKHFLANEWDRTHALKRGGGYVHFPIDIVESEWQSLPDDPANPETLFQKRWALSMLEHVMTKLRAEFVESGKVEEFEKLSPFLNGDSDPVRYETLARQIHTSAGALRMAVHRLR